MHTKSLLLATVSLLATSFGFAHEGHDHAAAVSAPAASNSYPLTTCVVSGDKLDDPVHYVYKQPGKPDRMVEFCCKDCIADFQKDPAKYLAKLDAAYAARQSGRTPAMADSKAGMAGMSGMSCAMPGAKAGAAMTSAGGADTSMASCSNMAGSCTDPSACAGLVKTYVPVASALAADDLPKAKAAATSLAQQADAAGMKTVSGHATALANATDIAGARTALKALSRDVEPLVQGSKDYVVMYCPMVDADWIQTDAKVRNPYFGKKMIGCGEPKATSSQG